MNTKNRENVNAATKILFLLGSIGFFLVMVLDKQYWHTGVTKEGWPNFSIGYLIRSVVIIISVISIISIFWSSAHSSNLKLISDARRRVHLDYLSILGVLSASVIFLSLFIFKPSIFSKLSLEDSIIEWSSALLLFGCCIIIAFSFLKSRIALNIPKVTQLSLALMSIAFFVMAMEEISWFQRVFDIETPKYMSGNIQNEVNLHNFASNYVENIYYFGEFLFMVALPFIGSFFPYVSNNNYLKIFVARPFIGIIGSIACAYNFDMWNIIFTQIAFFGSIGILFIFAIFIANRSERYIVSFTIFIIVITQILFLINGVNFIRIWEVTEYKEFFISLTLFIYSLDVLSHVNGECIPERKPMTKYRFREQSELQSYPVVGQVRRHS